MWNMDRAGGTCDGTQRARHMRCTPSTHHRTHRSDRTAAALHMFRRIRRTAHYTVGPVPAGHPLSIAPRAVPTVHRIISISRLLRLYSAKERRRCSVQ